MGAWFLDSELSTCFCVFVVIIYNMGKKCSAVRAGAVGCHNAYMKGSRIHFYIFPTDPECRSKWIAAIGREKWQPK